MAELLKKAEKYSKRDEFIDLFLQRSQNRFNSAMLDWLMITISISAIKSTHFGLIMFSLATLIVRWHALSANNTWLEINDSDTERGNQPSLILKAYYVFKAKHDRQLPTYESDWKAWNCSRPTEKKNERKRSEWM